MSGAPRTAADGGPAGPAARTPRTAARVAVLWTPAELAATTEAMWPPNLAALLADLRAHGPRDPAPDLGRVPGKARA